MRDKTASYDDKQHGAVRLTCTPCNRSWDCTERKFTCPQCHKPTLRKPRAPRPIEGRQS